jgi:glycosyltransferase involved in cell wall biosynthesis
VTSPESLDRSLRVVHLYDGHEQVHEGRGSVPGVVWNVARETAARGHDVTVLERQWDGLPQSTTHEGVRFERLDLATGADEPWTRVPYEQVTSPVGLARLVGDRTNFALAALRWLRGRERSVDVLHVHLPFAANVILTLAPTYRDRTVFTAHLGELRLDVLEAGQEGTDADGPDVPGFLSVFSPDVFLAKRASHTTVLNEGIADVFHDHGVPDESLTVVPNGVDVDRFTNVDPQAVRRVRREYDGFASDPGPGEVSGVVANDGGANLDQVSGESHRRTLLFVGTIMPRKGVFELVRAFGSLLDDREVDDVDLIIAGESDLDDEYVRRIETFMSETGLESHVHMPGFVPAEDLPALYHAADAFVMPSLEEGFGMTAVEALACGTPVVGTRVGAIPDIVSEGSTGYLTAPGDVEELVDALDSVLSADRSELAQSAQAHAREYSWASVGATVEGVYAEVTDE